MRFGDNGPRATERGVRGVALRRGGTHRKEPRTSPLQGQRETDGLSRSRGNLILNTLKFQNSITDLEERSQSQTAIT
jgi:hypothetical protein